MTAQSKCVTPDSTPRRLNLSALTELLEDPAAHVLPRDAEGRFGLLLFTGKQAHQHRHQHQQDQLAQSGYMVVAATVRAIQTRGYAVKEEGPGVYRVYPSRWEARPAREVAALPDDPAAVERDGRAGRWWRETRPDEEELSPLAYWLFSHYTPGATVEMLGNDGVVLGRYGHRPIRAGETDAAYWNDFGRALPAGSEPLYRLGEGINPPSEFQSLGQRESLRAMQVAAEIKASTVGESRYNW